MIKIIIIIIIIIMVELWKVVLNWRTNDHIRSCQGFRGLSQMINAFSSRSNLNIKSSLKPYDRTIKS